MILFGNTIKKLTNDRKTPDSYDFMVFNKKEAKFNSYQDGVVIQLPFPVGWEYHIILYRPKLSKKADPTNVEFFTACLINPLDYAESVISNGYYGYIGKISNQSIHLFNDLYMEIKSKGTADQLLKDIM